MRLLLDHTAHRIEPETGAILPGPVTDRLHWQLPFPRDDLDAIRTFCDEVDERVQALIDLSDTPGPPAS
jgi:hypothetical protein